MIHAKRCLSFVLVVVLCFQLFAGCSHNSSGIANGGLIEESKIYQEFISSHKINEEQIQAEYICENLIHEDGIEALGKGYEVAGDQKGHIIADRFCGANSIANLVPMSAKLNQGDYWAIENLWAEAIQNGQLVEGTIKFLYDGASYRPSRMDITYLIDGLETFVKLFN